MSDVYPNEAWPQDAEVEPLDGTSDAATGLPYIAKGVGPTSTPSYEVQYNRRQQRQNEILGPWRQGQVVDEGGLQIGVYPLDYTRGSGRMHFSGATGLTVPDDAVRFVYLDEDNQVQVGPSWPADATQYVPLAQVNTSNGAMAITDKRILTAISVPQVISAGDGLDVNLGQVGVDVSDFAGEGLEDDGAENLRVKLDGGTIGRSAAGVKVADNNLDGRQQANLSANGGVLVVFSAALTGGSTVAIHSANAPFKYRVIDAWSVATSADGGTWKVDDGANAITNTVTVTGTDKTINRAGTIDDAYQTILAGGSLRVVGDGSLADVIVYVLAVRVS